MNISKKVVASGESGFEAGQSFYSEWDKYLSTQVDCKYLDEIAERILKELSNAVSNYKTQEVVQPRVLRREIRALEGQACLRGGRPTRKYYEKT